MEIIEKRRLGRPKRPTSASTSGWSATIWRKNALLSRRRSSRCGARSSKTKHCLTFSVCRRRLMGRAYGRPATPMTCSFGSGRPRGRDTVEACRSIDVHRLHRNGCVRAGWMGGWQALGLSPHGAVLAELQASGLSPHRVDLQLIRHLGTNCHPAAAAPSVGRGPRG